MARKSNKTAHVLNLLAGHDSQKTSSEETTSVPEVPASSETEAASSPAGQTVSVIDHTETDPVAELIADKLREEFGADPETTIISEPAKPSDTTVIPEPVEVSDTTTISEPVEVSGTTTISEPAEISDTTTISEPAEPSDSAVISEPAKISGTTTISESSDSAVISEPAETSDSTAALEPEPASEPEAAADPQTVSEPQIPEEPEFIALNLMERIVRDKIIYYMRQFDVCTCPRCVADTIALTLNGLPPKYIVTTPAAVDPLISFYTNKFIADITVEATKACMTIRENPRH